MVFSRRHRLLRLRKESPDAINQRADTALTAIRAAAKKAPANGTSSAQIATGVAADQIERATDMYKAGRRVSAL